MAMRIDKPRVTPKRCQLWHLNPNQKILRLSRCRWQWTMVRPESRMELRAEVVDRCIEDWVVVGI